MVLRVEYNDISDAVRTYAGGTEVFVSPTGEGCVVSARHPKNEVIVLCEVPKSSLEVTEELLALGLKVKQGSWSTDEDEGPLGDSDTFFVVAVAYRSREQTPGVWVDCFPYEPTRTEVLTAMYEEFVESGDVSAVGLDEFIKNSHANVLIVAPSTLESFARRRGTTPV